MEDVESEDQQMPWEASAEQAVKSALEAAEWDYEKKTVSITWGLTPDGKSEAVETFDNYNDLVFALHDIYDEAWGGEVPVDSGSPVFDGDPEGFVPEALEDYEDNLKKLGWSQ